jgi:peptide/nickel transport system permease protein
MAGSLARTVGRVAGVALVVLGVTALTWLSMRVLRPSWFAGDTRSVPVQLGDYLRRGFVHFDFGRTFQPPSDRVADVIRRGLPADVSLILGATAFGAIAGAAGGAYCAARRGTALALAFEGAAAFFIFAPLYVVGLTLILLFGADIAYVDVGIHIPRAYVPFADGPLRWAGSLVVPWILTGMPLAALLLRLTRTAMVGVLGEDFIRAASGKGLTQARVLRRHALPAAAAPVIAATGMTVNLTITNVVLMETVFGIPGVFGRLRGAIAYGDFPMLMGITVVGAAFIAIANLLADLSLAWLDPRTRR